MRATLAFLMEHIDSEIDACIDWPFGSRAGPGYGGIWYRGTTRSVPVLVCGMKHGPKPSRGHVAAHSCCRPICINHRHLRWATRKENTADMKIHGTQRYGERHPMAKLTEAQVREIRGSPELSSQSFASRFGVSRRAVRKIRSGVTWSWLDVASAEVGPESETI